jgi:hypothetical protein
MPPPARRVGRVTVEVIRSWSGAPGQLLQPGVLSDAPPGTAWGEADGGPRLPERAQRQLEAREAGPEAWRAGGGGDGSGAWLPRADPTATPGGFSGTVPPVAVGSCGCGACRSHQQPSSQAPSSQAAPTGFCPFQGTAQPQAAQGAAAWQAVRQPWQWCQQAQHRPPPAALATQAQWAQAQQTPCQHAGGRGGGPPCLPAGGGGAWWGVGPCTCGAPVPLVFG